MRDRVIVGHHIGFDLAVLRHEAARASVDWVEPHSIDLALLVAGLEPGLPDHGMENVASWLGVEIRNRHTALGDCRAVVDMIACLFPLLAERGVTTLGQAMAIADSRVDLIRRERRVGWHSDPTSAQQSTQQQLDELREIKQAQYESTRHQLDDGVSALDIQSRIGTTNLQLHRKVVDLCINEMADNGDGEPPVEFDAIIIGSGSRLESLLHPDQDNALILDCVPDMKLDAVDKWFESLSRIMTDALAEVGFYHCPGWVMATNPRWRKPVDAFREQVFEWIRVARGEALHYCNIFLDFDNFYGNGDLTRSLRDAVFQEARNRRFLTRLYDIHKDNTGALNWYGRVITNPNPDANKGKIDLKVGGTLPIVTAVRILSLHTGINAQTTRERIARLAESGHLDEADPLLSAYEYCVYLLLRQQVDDHRQSKPVGNFVSPEALSRTEMIRLADELKVVRKFCKRVSKIVRS